MERYEVVFRLELSNCSSSGLDCSSWAVLWNWQGQQAVQNEFFNKLSYLVPLLAAAVVVFIINLLVVFPYRLTNVLHLERRATIEENEGLKERLKPTLIVELARVTIAI